MSNHAKTHLELTESIDAWLRKLGCDDPNVVATIAVDLADILRAGAKVQRLVDQLVSLDPRGSDDASEPLQVAAHAEVQLFTELKSHLHSLEETWPSVLDRLDQLGTEVQAE